MNTLGRYEIIEKIGSGSMGTVYRARDTALDREIALKTIRTGAEVEPELRERFYREARACARLHHPHIIIVHDLGEVDQIAYIAMELLDGRDLRKVITEREPIPVVVRIELMVQICEALAYAHSRGIVHRDVKPSNLFLVGESCAKVLDFGIARLPSSHLTAAGKILGTPNYMAPEQILGKPTDARSDLFSAAVVFFELLAYAHPFKSQLIPRRIVESEPDSLFDYDSKLPVLLEGVFARALAKDPEQRYQRVDDLGADLRAIAEGLRQNASPSFSGVQLPSARDFARTPVAQSSPADLSLLQPVPAGEDPYEWRFSEVLRLIPEFETALDQGNTTQARKIVAQLEAIEAVDNRFGEAVSLCRKRLLDSQRLPQGVAPLQSEATGLKSQAATTAPGATDAGISKFCPGCGTPNRLAAQFCIRCGSSFAEQSMERLQPSPDAAQTTLFKVSTLPQPGPPVQPQPPQTQPKIAERVPPPPVIPSTPAKGAGWTARQKAMIFGGAGLLAVLVLVGFLLMKFLRPEVTQPAVATALVQAPKTAVFKEPGKSRLVTLSHGDRVQVLKLPSRRDQEWVSVQFVSPKKVFPPGYVHTADLENWDSSNADNALSLIRMFGPPVTASESEVDAQIQLLDKFSQRAPESKASALAHLEIATLDMSLIHRKRAVGEPKSAWAGRLDDIRKQLEAAGSSPEVQAPKDDLQREMTALAAEPEVAKKSDVPPVSQVQIPRDNMNQLLEQARGLWKENRYEEAEAVVERVLRFQPANPDAIALQKKIKVAIDFEKSTVR